MSDKLKLLNKIFALVVSLQIVSCSLFESKIDTNTEVFCPNGSVILVKFIHAKDLRNAINVAYQNKKRLKTSENYTPIRLLDGRSFVLKGIAPEVASSCELRESKIGEVESTYIHDFKDRH